MKSPWARYRASPGAVAALAALLAIGLAAVLAPMLYPDSPWDMVGTPFSPPFASEQILGTDTLGRDVLAGVVHGARVSLTVGIVSTMAAILLGVLVGALAGYCGGRTDDVLMRFTEFFQTIPNFIFAIVLVAVFRPSIVSVVAAIAVVSWPPVARLVRAEFLTLRNREFVQAAIIGGQSDASVIFREILPNALSPIIVTASLMVATAILLESSISFLGLGDPNLMTWGYMVGASRSVIRQAWWMGVFPGFAIMLTVLSINLVGDGLNAALNPRSEFGT